MYADATDPLMALRFAVFTGAKNSEADYQAYVDSIQEFDRRFADHRLPAFILVIDEGNPPPNAVWRKRIAEASRVTASKPLFAMVTQARLIRGVITAVNWIRPPPYSFKVSGTVEAAISWIGAHRGSELELSAWQALLAEARAAVQ